MTIPVFIETALPVVRQAVIHLDQYERRSPRLKDASAVYYQMCAATALELLAKAPDAFLARMPASMALSELAENLQLAQRLADNRKHEFPVLDALLSRLMPNATRPAAL